MYSRRCALVVGVLLFTCSFLRGGVFAEETHAAIRIAAVYRVDLAVFNLGSFRLTTTLKGSDYRLRGEARFSVLGGLVFEGRGTAESSGKVIDSGPEPEKYTLRYVAGDKRGKLRMSFNGGAVVQVSMVPKKKRNPHNVPTTKEQLAGVLDPMTGGFLSVHSDKPNGDVKVCDRTIPVFDGERRFDIVLTPKRTVRVEKEIPTGYSGDIAVCRVKFIPISGHRPDNRGNKLMSQTDEIEVWIVSLPGTIMYLPYRIVLPTPIGYGSATMTSFQIEKD